MNLLLLLYGVEVSLVTFVRSAITNDDKLRQQEKQGRQAHKDRSHDSYSKV